LPRASTAWTSRPSCRRTTTPEGETGSLVVLATHPRRIARKRLQAAIDFEFDLPISGRRTGLADQAKAVLMA
jgi:hypothetical protein